jgi:hypothetical protein
MTTPMTTYTIKMPKQAAKARAYFMSSPLFLKKKKLKCHGGKRNEAEDYRHRIPKIVTDKLRPHEQKHWN